MAKKPINTTLSGYGNYGYSLATKLSDEERKAVLEYLKNIVALGIPGSFSQAD